MKKTRRVKVIITALIISFMVMTAVLGRVFATTSALISKVATTDKVIALTFDDGSDGGNAEAILAVLANYNAKATFFVTGKGAEDHPDIIKKIAAAGHPIGNHSYSHPYFTQISASEMVSELQKTESIIKNLTGKSTIPYFRPPYGAYDSTVLQVVGDAGYTKTIYWTIDTVDWKGVSTDEIVSKVVNNATPGAIVLMHTGDGATNTKYALPTIITNLKSQGY